MSGKSTFNWCFIGAGTLANTVAGEILPSGWHKVATVYTPHAPQVPGFCEAVGRYGL